MTRPTGAVGSEYLVESYATEARATHYLNAMAAEAANAAYLFFLVYTPGANLPYSVWARKR